MPRVFSPIIKHDGCPLSPVPWTPPETVCEFDPAYVGTVGSVRIGTQPQCQSASRARGGECPLSRARARARLSIVRETRAGRLAAAARAPVPFTPAFQHPGGRHDFPEVRYRARGYSRRSAPLGSARLGSALSRLLTVVQLPVVPLRAGVRASGLAPCRYGIRRAWTLSV